MKRKANLSRRAKNQRRISQFALPCQPMTRRNAHHRSLQKAFREMRVLPKKAFEVRGVEGEGRVERRLF